MARPLKHWEKFAILNYFSSNFEDLTIIEVIIIN